MRNIKYVLSQEAESVGCVFEVPRDGDAGYDLCSRQDLSVLPGETVKVRTGLHLQLPPGHVGVIKDKSSVAALGLSVVGGVIDESYRGEVIVVLYRRPSTKFFSWLTERMVDFLGIHIAKKPAMLRGYEDKLDKEQRAFIPAGSRIAQLLVLPVVTPGVTKRKSVDDLDVTVRGDGGFGSTGNVSEVVEAMRDAGVD